MRSLLRLVLIFCLGGWLGTSVVAATSKEEVSFLIQPPAPWVEQVASPDAPKEVPQGDGIDYLLVDQQENVQPAASYFHMVRSIFSQNGVQNGSAISVSFDPTYQKLVFHFLRVIRKGHVMDRLDRSRIQLLQREKEMEYFLYDGSYTAQCQLEDIRVGDVIDFAYTIEGANPVMQGLYTQTFSTNWNTPVRHARARLVHPSSRKLFFQQRNKSIEPTITESKGKTQWLWEERDIPTHWMDGSTPTGYNTYGAVQVTEFGSWREVVDWALPLYEIKPPQTPELQKEIAKLKAIADEDRRVLAALRFVQDEIRYLGIQIGAGSHQPTHPTEVLRRRFGDCKDKTLLLAALLGGTGIEAAPALVNTTLRKEIANRLPSPTVFNHVILRVATQSGIHWLDPTRSQQRGSLPQIPVDDYGQALIIRPGETQLSAFSTPQGSLPRTRIVEKYRISRPNNDSFLDVTTEYRGVSAERIRIESQERDHGELQKKYLSYYARRFPEIEATGPATFEHTDDEEGFIISEHYRIPNIWQLKEDKSQYTLSLHPSDLDYTMGETAAPRRVDPLALNYPLHFTHEIHAEFFQKWPLKISDEDVKTAYFHYQHRPKATNNGFEFNYSFQTLTDRVSPADLVAHNTALDGIKNMLGYSFTHRTPAQLAESKSNMSVPEMGNYNWPIIVSLGVFLLMVCIGCLLLVICSKSNAPPPLPSEYLQKSGPVGLGGWLGLVCFGMFASPISLIKYCWEILPTIAQLDSWNALTSTTGDSYHPLWAPALAFEAMLNSAGVIFLVTLLILFFKKRALFPKLYIGVLVLFLLGSVVGYAFCASIPEAAEALPESLKAMVQSIIGAAIWIPYFLMARRVKNTFRT